MSGVKGSHPPAGNVATESLPNYSTLQELSLRARGPRLLDASEAFSCQALVSQLTASLHAQRNTQSQVVQRRLSCPSGQENETQDFGISESSQIRPTTNHCMPSYNAEKELPLERQTSLPISDISECEAGLQSGSAEHADKRLTETTAPSHHLNEHTDECNDISDDTRRTLSWSPRRETKDASFQTSADFFRPGSRERSSSNVLQALRGLDRDVVMRNDDAQSIRRTTSSPDNPRQGSRDESVVSRTSSFPEERSQSRANRRVTNADNPERRSRGQARHEPDGTYERRRRGTVEGPEIRRSPDRSSQQLQAQRGLDRDVVMRNDDAQSIRLTTSSPDNPRQGSRDESVVSRTSSFPEERSQSRANRRVTNADNPERRSRGQARHEPDGTYERRRRGTVEGPEIRRSPDRSSQQLQAQRGLDRDVVMRNDDAQSIRRTTSSPDNPRQGSRDESVVSRTSSFPEERSQSRANRRVTNADNPERRSRGQARHEPDGTYERRRRGTVEGPEIRRSPDRSSQGQSRRDLNNRSTTEWGSGWNARDQAGTRSNSDRRTRASQPSSYSGGARGLSNREYASRQPSDPRDARRQSHSGQDSSSFSEEYDESDEQVSKKRLVVLLLVLLVFGLGAWLNPWAPKLPVVIVAVVFVYHILCHARGPTLFAFCGLCVVALAAFVCASTAVCNVHTFRF